jgi:hypothetical protein
LSAGEGQQLSPDEPPADYVQFLLDLLWPAATTPHGQALPAHDLVVIPSPERPKLLVPRRPHAVAAGAIRNFKTTASRRERLSLVALGWLARSGGLDVLPRRLRVPHQQRDGGIEAHLSEVLGRPVRICVYIGPPRAVRKPVFQVLDARGETFAFAKLGQDRFTDDLVHAESRAVQDLGRHSWRLLRVPQVIHSGSWNGHPLLVQSAIKPGIRRDVDSELVKGAMSELAALGPSDSTPLSNSSYWHALRERVAAVGDSPFGAVLQRSVDELSPQAPDLSLRFGPWHGDWAPWNMVVRAEGVHVWDWEKYAADVPVGFDATHYFVQGSVVERGVRPAEAFAAALAGGAAPLLPAETGRPALLTWLYALHLATQYLEDREMEAGNTRMSRLSDWLGVTLEAARAATLTS